MAFLSYFYHTSMVLLSYFYRTYVKLLFTSTVVNLNSGSKLGMSIRPQDPILTGWVLAHHTRARLEKSKSVSKGLVSLCFEGDKQTETDRQTDRQRQADRQTETGRQTDRDRQTDRQRQADRQTETGRQRTDRQHAVPVPTPLLYIVYRSNQKSLLLLKHHSNLRSKQITTCHSFPIPLINMNYIFLSYF